MHRIPLLLVTPTLLWDRNLPEFVLFERTLNKCNVEETDAFLTILHSEAEFYKSQCYGMAEDMFSSALQCLTTSNSNSFAEGMFLINSIILRTPSDSPVLTWALKIRGNYSFHGCFFEHASNDYEMFLEVHNLGKCSNEDVCEVYGHLIICMYMMRQLGKVKKYFRSFKKYKAKLTAEVLQSLKFVRMENHIGQFIHEIDEMESVAPNVSEVAFFCKPHKDFNISADIAAASSSCHLYKENIYANDEIPKASIVLVEDPIMQSVNVPFVQCELCYSQSWQQVYTCLECRYKTYCSLKCIERDKGDHKIECAGYKQLTLLVLDSSNIFRMFVTISTILHEHVFNPKIFRKFKTAEDVWYKMLEVLKQTTVSGMKFIALIKLKPFYCNLTQTQYSTLVTTAFRLTLFIDKNTNLIETYFKKLHVSNKQKLILVGSILMRIHCNMLLNTFDFEIAKRTTNTSEAAVNDMNRGSLEQIAKLIKSIKPSCRQGVVGNIDKFYEIDIKTDIWQRSKDIIETQKDRNQITLTAMPSLLHVQPCNRIHRILSTYKDNIAELYFSPEIMHSVLYGHTANQPTSPTAATIMCVRIADMSNIERCLFVKKFARHFHNHISEYFLQLVERNREMAQVLSLYCPTLRKFHHSCMPNVEVFVLDNGVVIGKALRNIQKGEPLYVAYKAHYMRHVRVEREMFLRRLNLKCKCKCCILDHTEEPTNLRLAIYCDSCNGFEITPGHSVCPVCNTQYNNLLNKYRTIIGILENELKNKLNAKPINERDIYILNLIIYSHSKKYFVPQNEFRIEIELKMASYLALKNFAQQSYSIIKEIRNNVLKNYDVNFIWFTFYAEILKIIKIILMYNLEEKQYSLSSTALLDLCTLGLHIATGQKNYIDFYEIFDKECSYIMSDIGVLLKWKEQIVCNDFLPLAASLKKSKQNGKSKLLENHIPSL